MSLRQRFVPVIGSFVVIWVADFVIHHVWLGGFYKAHAAWWRPEAEMTSMLPLMVLAQFLLAWLMTVVYEKGYEAGKPGLAQGVRFGLLIGLLLAGPANLLHLVVYPYPASLIASWLIGGLIQITLAGLVIGALYQPEK